MIHPFRPILPEAAIFCLNCVSVPWSNRVQIIFTVAKVLGLGIIVVAGLVLIIRGMLLSRTFSKKKEHVSSNGYVCQLLRATRCLITTVPHTVEGAGGSRVSRTLVLMPMTTSDGDKIRAMIG